MPSAPPANGGLLLSSRATWYKHPASGIGRIKMFLEHVVILMLITFIVGLFMGVALARPRG